MCQNRLCPGLCFLLLLCICVTVAIAADQSLKICLLLFCSIYLLLIFHYYFFFRVSLIWICNVTRKKRRMKNEVFREYMFACLACTFALQFILFLFYFVSLHHSLNVGVRAHTHTHTIIEFLHRRRRPASVPSRRRERE